MKEKKVNQIEVERKKSQESTGKLVLYTCLRCGAKVVATDEETARTLRLLHRCGR